MLSIQDMERAAEGGRAGRERMDSNEPVPRSEHVAGTLVSFRRYSPAFAVATLLADLAFYAATFAGFFLAPSGPWRIAAGLLHGLAIALTFVVAHDCAHQGFTGSCAADKILGRIAFLPAYHSFSLWVPAHNREHHGFTNLKPYDCSFTPSSKEEYDRYTPFRRFLERVYRHPLGLGVYYFHVFWLKRFVLPRARDPRTPIVMLDSALIFAFMGAELAVIAAASHAVGLPLWQALLGIVVLPQAVWNWLMGFTIYVQHTHERVRWFVRREEWSFFGAQVAGTLHVRWPRPIEVLFHNIMKHTAHHVDPHIPLYSLPAAQEDLERRFPETIPVVRFTPWDFLRTTRRCKLYDFENHRWMDFDGRPTTEAHDLAWARPSAARLDEPEVERPGGGALGQPPEALRS